MGTSAAQAAIASVMKAVARVRPSYDTWFWQIGGTPDLSDVGLSWV